MEKINAVITGVGGYVPDYVLTNDEISRMVDTNDEWIMTRIGVKERRILNEEGLGSSYMARKAAKQLMQRTGADPDDIDLVIVATSTPDYHFPSTASILCDKLRLKNAYAFDLQAACSGFLYLMETAANFIRSGRYKKVIIVGADKMSSMVDYTDRATCPIFGDGAAAFMLADNRRCRYYGCYSENRRQRFAFPAYESGWVGLSSLLFYCRQPHALHLSGRTYCV
mgnify:CR=1 FL=1